MVYYILLALFYPLSINCKTALPPLQEPNLTGACWAQKLDSLTPTIALHGQQLAPAEFLTRLGVEFCASQECQALKALAPQLQRPNANTLEVGDCELTIPLSDTVESFFYRHNATGADQCQESVLHLLNGCIKKGSNRGRLVHADSAQYELGFRPVYHHEFSLPSFASFYNIDSPKDKTPPSVVTHTSFCATIRPLCSRPSQSVECFLCSLDDTKPHPGLADGDSRYCKPKYV